MDGPGQLGRTGEREQTAKLGPEGSAAGEGANPGPLPGHEQPLAKPNVSQVCSGITTSQALDPLTTAAALALKSIPEGSGGEVRNGLPRSSSGECLSGESNTGDYPDSQRCDAGDSSGMGGSSKRKASRVDGGEMEIDGEEDDLDGPEGKEDEGDSGKKDARGALKVGKAKLPRPEGGVSCPRCGSEDTKFCYYNNYNIKQPRYFCKTCQRYWTVGGTLRNVPVGSGRRKSKSGGGKDGEPANGMKQGQLDALNAQAGLYGQFRNILLDPMFAYGGMVAGKAHPMSGFTGFSFPCLPVDAQQPAPSALAPVPNVAAKPTKSVSDGLNAKVEVPETQLPTASQVLHNGLMSAPEMGALAQNPTGGAMVVAEDGSVDGRRLKMKTDSGSKSAGGFAKGGSSFQQYRPAASGLPNAAGQTPIPHSSMMDLCNAWMNGQWSLLQSQQHPQQQQGLSMGPQVQAQPAPSAPAQSPSQSLPPHPTQSSDTKEMIANQGALGQGDADWLSLAAAAASQQMAHAVMAAAGAMANPQVGGAGQNGTDFQSITQAQRAQAAQVAQAAQAQVQAQVQVQQAQQAAQAQAAQAAQAEAQAAAAQAALRMQAAQAIAQAAMANWGQNHMPYGGWPSLWPYGPYGSSWAAAAAASYNSRMGMGGWNMMDGSGTGSGSNVPGANSGSTATNMTSVNTCPPNLPAKSHSSLPPSQPVPVPAAGNPTPPPQVPIPAVPLPSPSTMSHHSFMNHMVPSNPGTASAGEGSQAMAMPAAGPVNSNPWMQPTAFGMGWGMTPPVSSPMVPPGVTAWPNPMTMNPQVNAAAAFQAAFLPQLQQVMNGGSMGGNGSALSGGSRNSTGTHILGKHSRSQDSSVF